MLGCDKMEFLNFNATRVRISDLLLDPNNPRFGFCDHSVDVSQLKDVLVQEHLLSTMKLYNIEPLKQSIITNGINPLDRLAVVRLEEGSSKYVVIEGNRRVAAVKHLLYELKFNDELRSSLEMLDVCVLVGKVYDDSEKERVKIQGLRHLSGFEEWGEYEKGRFLYNYTKIHGGDIRAIGAKVGLKNNNANCCYKAMESLESLKLDSSSYPMLTSEKTMQLYFPYFYEVMRHPSLRDGYFEFNKGPKGDTKKVAIFCEWIGLSSNENTSEIQIKTPNQVTDLQDIVINMNALKALESGAVIEEALLISREDETLVNSDFDIITEAFIAQLRKIKRIESKSLSRKTIRNLSLIAKRLPALLKQYKKSN